VLADRIGAAGGQWQRRIQKDIVQLLGRPATNSVFGKQLLQSRHREPGAATLSLTPIGASRTYNPSVNCSDLTKATTGRIDIS